MKTLIILMLIINGILTTVILKYPKEVVVTDFKTVTRFVEVQKTLEYEKFEITAYTAGFESTGKTQGHDAYGITASGEMAIERITLACPQSLEFGTKVYIPAFETVFTCQDRGSAIGEGKLDVYMQDLRDAQIFGRQRLEVYILKDKFGAGA